jgi:hypothetical protein
MARQAALFLDRGERLWEILQKTKTVLDAEEYTILEEACRANAPVKSTEKRDLVAAWMTAYAKGCGTKAPRLTENEAGVLGQLAKRVGGAEALLVLIRVYFPWRKTWPKNLETPQPTPFGLQKHIAKVQEYAAQNANRSTLSYGARDVEAARKASAANPVDPQQMKSFVQQLKGGLAATERIRRPQ